MYSNPQSTYIQFFTEANETYRKLQQQHEVIRMKFTCDKTTPLQDLQELLKGLEVTHTPKILP